MSILQRLLKMVRADLNGLLDTLEDPIDLCNQSVRDMEHEIELTRQRIAEAQKRHRNLLTHREQTEQRAHELNEQLQVCLASGDRELTKGVLRRKLELEKRLKGIVRQLRDTSDGIASDERALKNFQERVAAVREKLECFAAQLPNSMAPECDEYRCPLDGPTLPRSRRCGRGTH